MSDVKYVDNVKELSNKQLMDVIRNDTKYGLLSLMEVEDELESRLNKLSSENERLRGALEAIRDHHKTLDWNTWNDPADALVFMQGTATQALKENSDE